MSALVSQKAKDQVAERLPDQKDERVVTDYAVSDLPPAQRRDGEEAVAHGAQRQQNAGDQIVAEIAIFPQNDWQFAQEVPVAATWRAHRLHRFTGQGEEDPAQRDPASSQEKDVEEFRGERVTFEEMPAETGAEGSDDGAHRAGQSEEPPPAIDIHDDDVAHLYYTSGTTGRPKGVMLTHKNVKSHALGTIAEYQLTDRDHWFHVAPLFHLADAWATFAITWAGGKHVLIPAFEPLEVLQLIEKEKITLSNLIPTMLNMMVNHESIGDFDYSSLRVILSGGAPIAPETVRKIIEAFKCDYIQTYGMTETSPYLTVSILKEHLKDLPWKEQLEFKAKTGREFINVSLRVVDEAGKDVAQDDRQVGEIIVKGDTVTPGYWNLPEETRKAIRDGWLYTGDLAVIDEERYVNIVDRKKDMILTGGENVYSTEVENVLYAHPAVLEAAVIGIPDPHWGEAVKACIVLKPGQQATETDIISFCKEELAGYKAPKSVDFIDSLPKTGSGKIYKKGLRDPYL